MGESRGADRSARWAGLGLGVVAALGIALRVRALLAGRSLWLDEAMIALNVCGRSFAGLLRPLDYDQAAPLGFLFLERLAVCALGPTELALRLVPFAASVATLLLLGWFGRVNFGRWGAVVGVGLAAVTPSLISYAGEAKQYAVDVAAGVLVLDLAAGVLGVGLSARRAAALALAGGLAVWLSHPVAFVLGGVGVVLIAREASQGRYDRALALAGVAACWLASFTVHYVGFARGMQSNLQSNPALAEYWALAYLPWLPRSVGDVRQYVVIGLGLFETLFQNTQVDENLAARMTVVSACAWLAGVVVLARQGARQRWLLALLVAPLVVTLGATAAHAYPLRFRLALFTAGPTLLVITAGVTLLWRSADGTNRAFGSLMLLGVGFLPAMQAAQFLADRPPPYGARTVLAGVARQWRPGDVVLVDKCSEPPFRFYRAYGRDPELRRVAAVLSPADFRMPGQLAEEVRRQAGRDRVWLVYSAHLYDPGGREDRLLTFLLDQWGRRLDTIAAKGYYAHLYDFGSGQPALARAPSRAPRRPGGQSPAPAPARAEMQPLARGPMRVGSHRSPLNNLRRSCPVGLDLSSD